MNYVMKMIYKDWIVNNSLVDTFFYSAYICNKCDKDIAKECQCGGHKLEDAVKKSILDPYISIVNEIRKDVTQKIVRNNKILQVITNYGIEVDIQEITKYVRKR